MYIIELTNKYNNEYEEFLSSFDDSLLYYSLKYKAFLEDLLNCNSKYLIALDNDKIVGILPLMEKNGVINSLPFYGSNGGAIAVNDKTKQDLYKHFENIVKNENIVSATIVTHPFQQSEQAPIKYDYIDERIGQWTPLQKTEDDLMAIIDSSTRRNIRKAIKSNITIRIDNNAWEFLEKTHIDNMNAMGGNAKKPDFFMQAQKHFTAGTDYNVYVAEFENKPVAAVLLFYYNKTVEYFTPVTVDSARNLQPTALIIKTAMLDAADNGYNWWNWGGTWKSQTGVYRFKKKWGAKDFNYKYFTKLNNKDILKQNTDSLLKEYPNFFVVPFSELED